MMTELKILVNYPFKGLFCKNDEELHIFQFLAL